MNQGLSKAALGNVAREEAEVGFLQFSKIFTTCPYLFIVIHSMLKMLLTFLFNSLSRHRTVARA